MDDILHLTNKQHEVYKLLHPDFEGLSKKKAAKLLGITISSLNSRLANIKKKYPNAFKFKEIQTLQQKHLSGKNPNSHNTDRNPEDNEFLKNFNRIYAGYIAVSAKLKIPFELSKEDVYDLIILPCMVCNREGNNEAITEDGIYFKYNNIILLDVDVGFTYLNCYTVCDYCHYNRKWRNRKQFKKMGW